MIKVNVYNGFIGISFESNHLIDKYSLNFKQRKHFQEGWIHDTTWFAESDKIWSIMQDFVECSDFIVTVDVNEVNITIK